MITDEQLKELMQAAGFHNATDAPYEAAGTLANFHKLHNLAMCDGVIARWTDEGFQGQVQRWVRQCFGESVYLDVTERGDRFLEETLEWLQSNGYPKERISALADYVYSRPVGDPPQELGGVMVTAAAYASRLGQDMMQCGVNELKRISAPNVIDAIRRKQTSKRDIHGPLPGVAPAAQEADYEARYATAERLAKPAATSACDFCGARAGELHAFDCTALDEPTPPAGDVEALAREGLDYFEKTGDAGDKLYIKAIRELLASAPDYITVVLDGRCQWAAVRVNAANRIVARKFLETGNARADAEALAKAWALVEGLEYRP